ncbi:MAG: MFS transporter [Chloroflexi bacterium]|nr:MFS transporter [Chloroflexota bacterium]MBU1660341.1 MFS transporter [Chloroflexota bacterium]
MKRLHWYDYITINIYWLGLATVSQTNGLIQPLMIQRFVGPEGQGTAYGNLRLYTLMAALLAQALAGMLSDRSTLRLGRRRPFIIVGTLLNMGCIIAIGASPTYWFLFLAAVFSQMASNIAHGAEQGLIPDLVPEDRRGRFSGVKSVMELLPVIIVALTVGSLIAKGMMWAGILVAIGILFVSMLITMLVREEPLKEAPEPLDWQSFGRLVAMTLVFLAVILGSGALVRSVGNLLTGVSSLSVHLVVMGIVGLLGMVIAVVVGVWGSVRIGLGGDAARRHPSFSWWVINRLAFLVGATNLAAFAIYFLQARLGLEGDAAAGPASKLLMIVGVLVLLFALPSGWLADKIGRKRLVALSGIVAAIGTLVLILSPDMTMIYVGGCIVGAAIGTFFTTNWALGTDIVPKAEAGRYLGVSNLAGAGAGAVGAYIGGPIADYFTAHVPQAPETGYLLIFGIYGVLFLLSSIVLMRVQEPERLLEKICPQN